MENFPFANRNGSMHTVQMVYKYEEQVAVEELKCISNIGTFVMFGVTGNPFRI